MVAITTGQIIQGTRSSYSIIKNLHRSIWVAYDAQHQQQYIVKTASPARLKNERDVLTRFRGQGAIRQLVDEVADPPLLILEKLDSDMLHESWKGSIHSPRLKQVAWHTLKALQALHEAGFVHTDVKPDNVLVNYNDFDAHYAKVVLSDNGDTVHLESLPISDQGHVIGSHIFRSPEAMLNFKWGSATDIWSFGTMLISLIWGRGWHIFKPSSSEVSVQDETFPLHVLRRQDRFFGPFPISYTEIADDESLAILEWVTRACEKRTPFAFASEKEISIADRTFICKIMKLDPRARPTANELLQDEWFGSYEQS